MKYRLIVNFTEKAFPEADKLWELANFSQALTEDEDSPPILNISTSKTISIADISKSIRKNLRKGDFSFMHNDDYPSGKMRPSIMFSPASDYGISQLILEGFDNIIDNHEQWLPKLFNHPDFISAWLVDRDYNLLQNHKKIYVFECEGLNHEALIKKSNGLPAPLNRVIVDTTYHVGYWIFKMGYREAVASKMWLGNRFFDAVNLDKAKVMKCEWLQTKIHGETLQIKAYGKPFDCDQGEQRDIQIKLRRLLFSESPHTTDATFSNLDKGIHVQKV